MTKQTPLSSFVVPNSEPTHYTPTTDEVQAEYVANKAFRMPTTYPVASEFQRWLAAHDSAIRAAALDEAAEDRSLRLSGHSGISIRALRARASAIRALKEEKK